MDAQRDGECVATWVVSLTFDLASNTSQLRV